MKTLPINTFFCLIAITFCCSAFDPNPSLAATTNNPGKTCTIVTTDGEIDDRCSMVRFLLYANEWDIRGLIHSSSKYHWKGDETVPAHRWEGTEWLDKQLEAYEQVFPSLLLHDPSYPSPEYLRSQVFVGNIAREGDMREPTPGSERIVQVLLEEDPSPVWLQAWGGSNTIARALKSIQENHPDRMMEVSRKARIYLISQQDKTFKEYIRKEWPEVKVLLSNSAAFGAVAYGWGKLQPPEVKEYFGRAWMKKNILDNHGPLCDLYEAKEERFRSEGDSPAFLHIIETGLRSDENPSYGGWGGRFQKVSDSYWKSVDGKGVDPHSILRWAIDFQNDWAARADWCVKNYEEANHPPIAIVQGSLDRDVKPGQVVDLSAEGSSDPDGDSLSYRWYQHDQADTASQAEISHANTKAGAQITIPEEPGKDLHIILEVSDDGSPPLKRWQRVICTIAD